MTRSVLHIASIAVLAASALAITPAHAGLNGSSVVATLNYFDQATVHNTAGPVTVGPGVEFGPNAILNGRNFGFDISDSAITYLPDENQTYGNGAFNGFVLTFTGAPRSFNFTWSTSTRNWVSS